MAEASKPSWEEKLAAWRQGDFALDVGGFLLAEPANDHAIKYEAAEINDGVVGLVLISQTCDVVRATDDKPMVSVSPLVHCEPSRWKEILMGRFPSLTTLEHAPEEQMVVDLGRTMCVTKELLAAWPRKDGFTTESSATRFAAALERKFGRFAFPDEFDLAMKGFQQRVRSRHTKPDSDVGKVYRSLNQLRFNAAPDWNAADKTITLLAILHEKTKREISDEEIRKELREQVDKVVWPAGYNWGSPDFMLATAGDLSGADILGSQLADFEYLSS